VWGQHRWALGIDIGLDVGDIRHPTSTSLIPISEQKMSDYILLFWYRNSSDIDINFHSGIGINQYRIFRYPKLINHFLLTPANWIDGFLSSLVSNSIPSWRVSGNIPLRYKDFQIVMSDIGYRTKVSSDIDIMSDFELFSPISDVPISGSVRYRWSRISEWVPTYGGQ
jgi:hypothetical protein